jgi:branched-chain amino acid transport system ATP-binding protein
LEIENLSSGYDKLEVLHEVGVEIHEGSIVALLGPNGSGKSTLLKTVFGLTTVYGGSIKYRGTDITKAESYEIARLGISYLPQVENLYSDLSVRENLIMGAYVLQDEERDKNVAEAVEFFPSLKGLLNEQTFRLSGGQKQMLVMARALMRKPILMMLDEPSANLSQKIMTEVFQKIEELRQAGITLILVEQNVTKALEISDYTYLMVSGRVNWHGETKDIAANKEFGRLFLGI